MLLFEVKNQMLKRVDAVEPATDSQQYLKAKFTINDADWNGKAKTAFFRLGDVVYKALLNGSNECVVPSEVLVRSESRYARTQGSKIFVSLIGEYSTTRITTNEVCVLLNASGYSNAEEPKNPTQSEYQQIITQYANNEAAINKAKAECETARADLVGVKNIFANAIKGNLSGAVVFADDVSPIEHNPIVKVHGKNLAKRTNANKTETNSGITYTVLEDGRVSASGTATGTAYYIINGSTDWAYQIPIKKGIYTIPKAPIDGCRISIGIRENQNTERVLYYSTPTNTVTFEVTSNEARFDMILCVDTGKTVNGAIFEPQLEKGETATEYEPYLEPSTVTVRRCGKQVFAGKEYELAKEYAWSSILIAKIFCGSGNYVASCNFKQKGDITRVALSVRDYDETTDTLKHVDTTDASGVLTAPFVVEEGKKGFQVFLYSNYSADDLSTNCLFENIQVEVGTEATPYQPYNATTHTPSSDGTVEGITSLSPNMTILTDTSGAIVECEYIKDTNKVLQKIADALNITI